MKAVSVIIPVYQVAPYIERCLRSVLGQTFRDFEVIAVDDASRDDSMAIATRVLGEQTDIPWKVVTHEKNRGLSAARNSGIAQASGRYVYLPDGDDHLEPELLERLYAAIQESEADIVTFGCRSVYEANDRPPMEDLPSRESILDGVSALRFFLEGGCRAYICMQFFRTTLFTDIRFPEGQVYEDRLTLPHLYLRAGKVRFLRQVLYNYVQRPGSITQTFHPEMVRNLRTVRELRETLEQRFREIGWKDALLTFDYQNTQSFVFTTMIQGQTFAQVRDIWKEAQKHIRWADLTRYGKLRPGSAFALALFKASPGFFWIGPRKYITRKIDESNKGH